MVRVVLVLRLTGLCSVSVVRVKMRHITIIRLTALFGSVQRPTAVSIFQVRRCKSNDKKGSIDLTRNMMSRTV